ncbi:unnamed protein product [Mytilus edulis]|uniref:DUF4590 domain-containing protein n=1 Tax=Mytilus edulis TaxID=6550 RepID=A0A8S3TKC2_MYTED|nr:unnamed protein product [Mytilus edulis]
MSQIHDGPLATYCSLTDKNLAGYFSNTKMRRHLKKAGLVDRRGQIISENQYRLNMARKEHKKHVKDLLAQAIVHKTLDIERNRQVEIKRKLEEIAKLEVVRRVRATKFRKGDEDILPYLSPRSSRPQSRSGRYRPQSAPADRQYNDSYDADVIYVDDEGRPVTPPKDLQEDHKREEIDTRHLYALDSAALKKYALTLSKIEQGEGMTSPYLISQVPSPPRSARVSSRNNYRDARFKSRLQRPRTANSLSPYRSTRTGAVQGTLMLHRQEPAMMHQGEVQTLCEVTMKYYGPNLILPRDQRDPTQDIEIEQQHCGGNTLPVFKERIKPGDEFTFISRRHRGYPFSLSIFVDGRISARVSTCCEYGHAKGVRLGGKMGQFCLKNITGATPCYKCKLNAQASPRTLKRPTSKKRQQKVEQIKEEIIVVRKEQKNKEEEDNYDDDFEDEESGSKKDSGTDTRINILDKDDTNENDLDIRGHRCEEDDEDDWSDIEDAEVAPPRKVRQMRSSTPVVGWDEEKEEAIISREENEDDDEADGKRHVHFDEDVQCIAASDESEDTLGQKESDNAKDRDLKKERDIQTKVQEFLEDNDTCDEVSEIETDLDSPRRKQESKGRMKKPSREIEKNGVTREDKLKRLQKQENEVYSDDFDSVTSYVSESSTKSTEVIKGESTETLSSESSTPKTGEYNEHKNKTPVDVVSQMHMHVSKVHEDDLHENTEVKEEKSVVVEENGDNYEIRQESDGEEDSSMEFRKGGPMSITFSEMDIIGPLATLLVKVRRRRREKSEKRSRKQMLIMIDESETDNSTNKASKPVDSTNKASDKPVNDSSVDTLSQVSDKQVDHTPVDATSNASVKEGKTDAFQDENHKAENSDKIICQGRLKPISKPKSRTTKKSHRSQHSDSSLSSVSSLNGSSKGTCRTCRREKVIVVKPAQATKETSMSEVEVETVMKHKIKPKKELISDHFDADIVTTPTVSISKETVVPQQNSNVRFVKPSYLQREYDDDDGYDQVRMKKMEEKEKKKDPTDEDILRQLIQSTFDESYEVDDDISVIDIDDDEPSITEKLSTTDKLSESFAQTVYLKKDNVNDDTNSPSKTLTTKTTKQIKLDNGPNLEVIGTKSKLCTELTDEIEEIKLDDDNNESENQTNKTSTIDKKTDDEQSTTKDHKEETTTSMDHEVKLVAEKSYSIKFKADSIDEINLVDDKTGNQKDENSVSQKNEKIATIDQTIHITADSSITVKLEAEVFKATQGRSEVPQVMASADFFDEKFVDEKQNVYLEKIQSVQKTETPNGEITSQDERQSNVTFIEVSVADPEDTEQAETDQPVKKKEIPEHAELVESDVKPVDNEVTDMLDGNDAVGQELWTVPRPMKYVTMLEERQSSIDESNIPVTSSYKTLLERESCIEKENKTEPGETVLNETGSQKGIQDDKESLVDVDHKEKGENTNTKQFIYQKYSVENQADTVVMESVTSKPKSSVAFEEDNLSISSAIVGEYVQTIIAEAKKIEEAHTVMNDHVQTIMSEAKKLEEIQVKSSVNDDIKSNEITEREKEEIQVKTSVNDDKQSDEINEKKTERLEEIEIKSSTHDEMKSKGINERKIENLEEIEIKRPSPNEMKSEEINESKKDEVMKTKETTTSVSFDQVKVDSSKDNDAMIVVDEVKVDETDKMSTTSETDLCSVSSSVIESYVNHVLTTATEQTVTNIAVSKQANKEDKVIPLAVDINSSVLLQEADSVKDTPGETMPATEIKVPEPELKTNVKEDQNELSKAVLKDDLRCKVEQQSVPESKISPKLESDSPPNIDPTVDLQENDDSTADTVSLTSVSSSVVLEYVGNVLETVKGELTTNQKVELNQSPDLQKESRSTLLTQKDMQRSSVVQSEIKSQVEDGKTLEVDHSIKEEQDDGSKLVNQSKLMSQVEDGKTPKVGQSDKDEHEHVVEKVIHPEMILQEDGKESKKDKHNDVEESSVSSSVVMEYVNCIVHNIKEDLSKINNKEERESPKVEQEVGSNAAEKEAVVPETPRTDPEGQESAMSAPESLKNISRAAIQKDTQSKESSYNNETKESPSSISTEQNEKKETIVAVAEIHIKQDTSKGCENVKVSENSTNQTSDVCIVGKEPISPASNKISDETVITVDGNNYSEEIKPEKEKGTEPKNESSKILKTETSQVTSKQIDKKILPDDKMITEAVNEHIYSDDSDEMRAVEVAVLETGMVGSLAAIIHLDSSSNESVSGATSPVDNKSVSDINGVIKEENQLKLVEKNHEDIVKGKAEETCSSEMKIVETPTTDTKSADTLTSETKTVDTPITETKTVDTTITDTKPLDTPIIETKQIDTPTAATKPVETSITETKSVYKQTTETKPVDTPTTETKPVESQTTETKPVDTPITETKPVDTPTTESKPVDTPTTETKQVDTPTTETKPVDTPTTETKLVDSQVTETKPVESPSTETKSVETPTIETKQVETPASEIKPSDTPIIETIPVDAPTPETKPKDTPAAATKPVETPTTDIKTVDKPTMETKLVEKPTTETKPVDTPTTETKPVENPTTETKPEVALIAETKLVDTPTSETKPIDTPNTETKTVEKPSTETKPVDTPTTETKPVDTPTTETKQVDTPTTETKPVDTPTTETQPDSS